jgi:ABC-type uncharacterized transport system substrate-binding protein
VSRVALLMNPTNPNIDVERMDAEAGARKLGLETVTLNARNAREIDTAFEQLLGAKADGIITATDPIPLDRREQIVALANQHKLPVVGFVRQFAAVGALLSYVCPASAGYFFMATGIRCHHRRPAVGRQ